MARPNVVPPELLPDIAERAGQGQGPTAIRDWLKQAHGVEVSTDTVRRDIKRATMPSVIAEQLRILLRQAKAVQAGKALRDTLVTCLNRLSVLVQRAELDQIGDVIRAIQVVGELDIAKIALCGDDSPGEPEPGAGPGQETKH